MNANPDDASPWVNADIIRPLFPILPNFTYTRRAAGQITMSWTPKYWTTGYEFDCATYDPAQTPHTPSYTRCATLINQDDTAAQHSVTISTWTDDGKSYSIDDTKIYDIRICSTNATGRYCWLVPLIAPNPSKSASGVTSTGATLTIADHLGDWYVKKTSPTPEGACSDAISGAAYSVGSLTPGETYTYKAYSDSGCTTAIATATFTTLKLAASSIADTSATLKLTGYTGNWYAKKTAPTPAGDCSSVIGGTTHDLSSLTPGGTYTYKAYSDSNCSTAIATANFTTLASSLAASGLASSTATIAIGNHSGDWYVKETSPATNAPARRPSAARPTTSAALRGTRPTSIRRTATPPAPRPSAWWRSPPCRRPRPSRPAR